MTAVHTPTIHTLGNWWHISQSKPSGSSGVWCGWASIVLGLWCYALPSLANPTPTNPTPTNATNTLTKSQCPADFRGLGSALVKDLPSYLTRVYSRARVGLQVMGAGQPEFEPLALAADQDTRHAPEQLFISVSERHSGEANNQQRAYWLFFVPTPKGWRLAMAFTRVGQAPPYDVSYGAISTATKEWLRDHCERF